MTKQTGAEGKPVNKVLPWSLFLFWKLFAVGVLNVHLAACSISISSQLVLALGTTRLGEK